MDSDRPITLNQAYADHNRRWHDFIYCYPVISRRSGGLSLGVNLNPDKACNFDCIYCQVDRTIPSTVRKVDLGVVRMELSRLLAAAMDGTLFLDDPFNALPTEQRLVRDIAFSGDGEPTTYPQFDQAVQLAADLKRERSLHDTRLVLITDACYLTRPVVAAGLRILDAHNGEIWAKLDAGTQSYFETVNRASHSLSHVLTNITEAARERPIVIQSLWMRVHDEPPSAAEVVAFAERLIEMRNAGAMFKLVQVYTIARRTTEAYVAPLSRFQLDRLASTVREMAHLPVETYYGVE